MLPSGKSCCLRDASASLVFGRCAHIADDPWGQPNEEGCTNKLHPHFSPPNPRGFWLQYATAEALSQTGLYHGPRVGAIRAGFRLAIVSHRFMPSDTPRHHAMADTEISTPRGTRHMIASEFFFWSESRPNRFHVTQAYSRAWYSRGKKHACVDSCCPCWAIIVCVCMYVYSLNSTV